MEWIVVEHRLWDKNYTFYVLFCLWRLIIIFHRLADTFVILETFVRKRFMVHSVPEYRGTI